MLTLRRGAPADLDLVTRNNLAMAAETEGLHLDPEVARRGAAGGLSGENGAFYLLAEQDGSVLGQLMVTTEWSDWRATQIWWIQSVYVAPEARRRGVYRTLHEAVQAEARQAGAPSLRLYVDAQNQAAMAEYRAMGMHDEHYRVFEQNFDAAPAPAR